jgi:hypothetical protein
MVLAINWRHRMGVQSVRAKFRVQSITVTQKTKYNPDTQISEPDGNSISVEAHPVAGVDNKRWADATPGGAFRIHIDNEEAGRFFRPGQYLYLDITEAPEKDPDQPAT